MRATFQNSGTMLSSTFFFRILIAGLASSLPGELAGWQASTYRQLSRSALRDAAHRGALRRLPAL
jgi:hypothetical protein